MGSQRRHRRFAAVFLSASLAVLTGGAGALLGSCGPFTDVAADAFCPFVLEIFYLGITTGTTPTTYDPTANVTRLQMAAFLSRTVDGVLKRGSRRAALDRFWTSQNAAVLGVTTLGAPALMARSDGSDVWVASDTGGRVFRVRASDGRLLETWTGATSAFDLSIAIGRVVVSAGPQLYSIDPTQPAGAVTTVATNLPTNADGIAFDGARFWTANFGAPASVSIITPGASIPWTVTTITTGFSGLFGAVFDGSSVWVTDNNANALLKLDSAGAILQTVTVGLGPYLPVFDGSNIWVPNNGGNIVSVVRASTGAVLQTITGIGGPKSAGFDGERVMISASADRVFLYKAADLTSLGIVNTGSATAPYGVCSDGLNFWIALNTVNQLARF